MNKFNDYFKSEDFWQTMMEIEYPCEKVGVRKYMSIQIMATMADYNIYEGRTNQYCYKMYEHFCIIRNIEPISKIAFSKFITMKFNYYLKSIKRERKVKRVYRQYKPRFYEIKQKDVKAGD